MRILIYGINFAPEPVGIGKYTGEMAQWLNRHGDEVCVVTAPPYYPMWSIAEGYQGSWYSVSVENGIRIFRCPIWLPTKVTGKTRLLHLLSYAMSSLPIILWLALRWRPSVIFTVAPTLLSLPGSLVAGFLAGARSWLHIQDFEVEAAINLKLLPHWLVHLAVSVESWLIRRFDHTSTISSQMLLKLLGKGGCFTQTSLLPNWVDTSLIYPLGRASLLRQELGISDDQIVILYSGSMGAKQGLEIIPACARQLAQDTRFRFVLCGNGPSRDSLVAQAQGLPNVMFLPLQPLSKLNELLNLADIHVVPQLPGVADLVMPSKLTGILASGGSVVVTADEGTELSQVIHQVGGIVCDPENVEQLVDSFMTLADNPALRIQMQQKAYIYARQNLSQTSVLQRFHQTLANAERMESPSYVDVDIVVSPSK